MSRFDAPSFDQPISQACTYEQIGVSEPYRRWCERMNLPATHRKLWEWCYILQVLEVAGDPAGHARRASWSAPNRSPLVAAGGAEVVATDLPQPDAAEHGWTETGEHVMSAATLGYRELCPADVWNACDVPPGRHARGPG